MNYESCITVLPAPRQLREWSAGEPWPSPRSRPLTRFSPVSWFRHVPDIALPTDPRFGWVCHQDGIKSCWLLIHSSLMSIIFSPWGGRTPGEHAAMLAPLLHNATELTNDRALSRLPTKALSHANKDARAWRWDPSQRSGWFWVPCWKMKMRSVLKCKH